jgi:hypothetical protein
MNSEKPLSGENYTGLRVCKNSKIFTTKFDFSPMTLCVVALSEKILFLLDPLSS